MLVDSHCHINFDALAARLEDVIANAAACGVRHLLCVSVNMEDFPAVREMAQRYGHVFASVGVHPNERGGRDPGVAELVRLAGDASIVALGETGLDYFRSQGDLDWQRERFVRHIHAARQSGVPIIVHSRDARKDTIDILSAEDAGRAGGVMHCFSETWEMARQALDLGFYISFSGIVTFKSARELQTVARKVPIDRILIETDAPYLAPVPMRGKTNEPAFVRHIAEHLAELRGQSLENFARATTDNFFRLFPRATRQPKIHHGEHGEIA